MLHPNVENDIDNDVQQSHGTWHLFDTLRTANIKIINITKYTKALYDMNLSCH